MTTTTSSKWQGQVGTRYSEAVPLDAIFPDPTGQPRRDIDAEWVAELADSIKSIGLTTPLSLRMRREGGYWIVAGHHRYEALRRLHRTTAPALIKLDLLDDEEAFEEAFLSNVGQPMNVMDEAHALRRIFHARLFGSNTQLARHVGRSVPFVTDRLLLLWLDEADQERVRRGQFPLKEAVAKAREITDRFGGKHAP